jgi:hypothetical protein
MKKTIAILVVAVVLAVGMFLFHIRAKSFVFEQLERSLGRPVRASSVIVRWPATVVIKGFKVGDGVSADTLIVKPSVWGMLAGKRVFNSFVAQKLLIRLVWSKDGTMDLGLPGQKEGPAPTSKARPVFVDHFLVEDGVVEFVDEIVSSPELFRLRVADIRLSAFRSSLVQPTRAKFSGRGRLADARDKTCGSLSMSGWVDFLSKDMDAEVDIQGLTAMDFAPYFQRYLKMVPAAGEIAVRSDLKSVRNDLEGKVRLLIKDLSLQSQKDLSSAEPRDWGSMILLGVLNAKGEITLEVSFKTKLDEPKFENVSLEHASMGSSGDSTVPPVSTEAIQSYKKIGEEIEAVGKEFKVMFKKEIQPDADGSAHETAKT